MNLLHRVGQNAPWTSFHPIEVGSNELKLRKGATGQRERERTETMLFKRPVMSPRLRISWGNCTEIYPTYLPWKKIGKGRR